jgi:hypothetical protein
LEIAAGVQPSPDSSHDLMDVRLAFRAARLFGLRIEEIFMTRTRRRCKNSDHAPN